MAFKIKHKRLNHEPLNNIFIISNDVGLGDGIQVQSLGGKEINQIQ